MIKLEFTGASAAAVLQEVSTFITDIAGVTHAGASLAAEQQGQTKTETPTETPTKTATQTAPTETPKRGRPSKASQANGAKEPNDPLDTLDSKPPSVDDVRAALTAFMLENGEDATTALLKKHAGVERLSQVKAEHYAAVIAAAKVMM